MKVKTTQRDMKEAYGNRLYAVGYCDLQHLLQYKSPIAYSTSNTYGWRCDLYWFEEQRIALTTGYAPVGKRLDYELVRKYDVKAEKIVYSRELSYEKKQSKIKSLLKRFLKEITKKGE